MFILEAFLNNSFVGVGGRKEESTQICGMTIKSLNVHKDLQYGETLRWNNSGQLS